MPDSVEQVEADQRAAYAREQRELIAYRRWHRRLYRALWAGYWAGYWEFRNEWDLGER